MRGERQEEKCGVGAVEGGRLQDFPYLYSPSTRLSTGTSPITALHTVKGDAESPTLQPYLLGIGGSLPV